MEPARIQEGLAFLSQGVLLATPSDLTRLASIHEALLDLARQLHGETDARLAAAATEAARLVESLILREAQDAEAALGEVAQRIAFIQAVVMDDRPIESMDGLPSKGETDRTAAASSEAVDAHREARGTDGRAVNAGDAPARAATGAAEAELAPVSLRLCGDAELTLEFVGESREHLEAVDASLLAIERDAGDTEALNAVFRAFHTIKGVAGFLDLTPIRELAHESETLLDRCRKGEVPLRGSTLDVVFEATDAMKALVASVEAALSSGQAMTVDAKLMPLVTRIRAAAEDGSVKGPKASPSNAGWPSTTVADTQTESTQRSVTPAPSEQFAAASSPTHPTISTAPSNPDAGRDADHDPHRSAGTKAVKESIRVDADRLDKLVDLIGEMVIAEAMVSQSAESIATGSSSLGRKIGHLDKITRELQGLAMSLRMVPVRSTFQRMARLARDVAKKLDKPIEFVTSGDDTDLDKNVVDAIGDPLVHMVRNAVDHGLEASVADRVAAGKSTTGRIELRAFHKGGSIYIEIEDDGRGLDRDLILAKARERGLTKDGDSLSDAEVFAMIFEPGFSTAKRVTDLSGRGVGLDVVRRNIQSMRGKVEIRSQKGRGSVFSIRLPLTLAIIEGMVVRLASQRFIVPTLSIVRMIRPSERHISSVFERGEMLWLGDQLLPLHRLDRLFEIEGAVGDPGNAAVLIVEHDNRQVAFMVDELLGQQQVVIKPLGALLRKTPGFSGGAILPDGKVGLILDVAGLTTLTQHHEPSLAA